MSVRFSTGDELRRGKEVVTSTYRSLSVIHMQNSESKGETVFLKSGLVRLVRW